MTTPLPEQKYIPIEALKIDHTYQRSVEGRASTRLIAQIAAGFAWHKFQPMTVCHRDKEDAFYVIDGQHRLTAVRRRGGIPKLPCYIVVANSVQEEAKFFIELNRNRVRMHTVDMFHAELAAGDENARLVVSVCKAAGVKVCKTPFITSKMPPGHTQCVGTLREVVTRYKPEIVSAALGAIFKAFPDVPGQMRESIIRSVIMLYAEASRNGVAINTPVLVEILREHPPARLEAQALMDDKFMGGTMQWVVAFLRHEYVKAVKKGKAA